MSLYSLTAQGLIFKVTFDGGLIILIVPQLFISQWVKKNLLQMVKWQIYLIYFGNIKPGRSGTYVSL